jgi:GT2 family glycosyltransferase
MAASAVWLGWDGARLRWRIDAAAGTAIELRLDGIVFERFADAAAEFEREFAYAPSGNAELEFSLHGADSVAIGPAWRVVHGRVAEPGVDQWQGAPRTMRALADVQLPPVDAWQRARDVAIVVPIYNSPELVRRCIDAVLRWTRDPLTLILIDDASTDPGIAPLLTYYASRHGARALRNTQNLGYTRTSNLGIETAGSADVVLLNSDTEVGPCWLQRLRTIAYAHDAVGTVTAVSDNAGAFTVPELEQYCPVPERWTLVQTQRALLHHAAGCLPELPTGNGFCMYIKRTLLERVGVLDAQAFPSGYGEENDLCQRAEHAGFRHVIAGDVLVRHARSASFGAERRHALGALGMAVLRTRYPDYEAKVGATLFSFARRVLDYRVRRIYGDADGFYIQQAPRPRILLVAASVDQSLALATACALRFECFALSLSDAHWRLHRYGETGPTLVAEAVRADEERLRVWLVRLAIEGIYLADGNAASASAQRAAASAGVPTFDALDALPLLALSDAVP